MNQRHVRKNVGIAGKVCPPSVAEMQHKTRWFPCIHHRSVIVVKAGAVLRFRHRRSNRPRLHRSALVHAHTVRHAFLLKPRRDLMVRHYFWTELFAQRPHRLDVIAMPVRKQNGVAPGNFVPGGIFRIPFHPRVNQNRLARNLQLKRTMPKPDDFYHACDYAMSGGAGTLSCHNVPDSLRVVHLDV